MTTARPRAQWITSSLVLDGDRDLGLPERDRSRRSGLTSERGRERDDPELASYLRIEEREFEAAG